MVGSTQQRRLPLATFAKSIDLSKLALPFKPKEIEWRVGRSGYSRDGKPWAMVLAYVSNRAIMRRLDLVCGPENWKNQFREWKEKSQLCGISIRIDGEWVTKWDGADDTDFEATKGGLSDSMKRAAVQWGIGRYLYYLDGTFADLSDKRLPKNIRAFQAPIKDDSKKTHTYWFPAPALPDWALPEQGKDNDE